MWATISERWRKSTWQAVVRSALPRKHSDYPSGCINHTLVGSNINVPCVTQRNCIQWTHQDSTLIHGSRWLSQWPSNISLKRIRKSSSHINMSYRVGIYKLAMCSHCHVREWILSWAFRLILSGDLPPSNTHVGTTLLPKHTCQVLFTSKYDGGGVYTVYTVMLLKQKARWYKVCLFLNILACSFSSPPPSRTVLSLYGIVKSVSVTVSIHRPLPLASPARMEAIYPTRSRVPHSRDKKLILCK